MKPITFNDQVIELDDIETGPGGRIYGDTRTEYGKPMRVGSVTHRVVTTPFCECRDLHDLLHQGPPLHEGTLANMIVRVTFNLTFEHEPATRDCPGYGGVDVELTKVEVVHATDGVVGTFSPDSNVGRTIYTLFADTLEGHEPAPIPEPDHSRI